VAWLYASMSLTYSVPLASPRIRADKALAHAFPDHSRVLLQRAFAAGLVRRNGIAIGQKAAVLAGETIEFDLPAVRASVLTATDIPLKVIFEDKHLIVINKPPGMVVHPGAGTGNDTLVHALLSHCHGSLSGIGGVERPGIVHRLDKETSGVLIAAKTDAAHRVLAAQFADRTVVKEYQALVSGVPALLAGSIQQPIGRHSRQRHRMTIVPEESGGRAAHTDWKMLEHFGPVVARVLCTLHTGRTHQIRVHLRSIGHPLLGDASYGWKADPRLPPPPRIMLHAEHLALTHPITGKLLDLRAPLPADFKAMAKALRALYPLASSSAARPQRRL
jgi:23S rRNA pseudouridine1911/1915/1917 synthase